MIISSMLIFSTIGMFRKYILLSSSFLAFLRGIIGALFLLTLTIIKGQKLNLSNKKIPIFYLTGALIGINWLLLFESYNYTSVGVATLCYYMQPSIVILLSPFLLKEKINMKKLLCVLTEIFGMFLLTGVIGSNTLKGSDYKGILFGLSAAFIYALVVLINKKTNYDDAYSKTIVQLFSAALVLVPYLLISQNYGTIELSVVAILLVIIVGVVHTGVAYVLYFASMKEIQGQSIALLSYIDPIFALIFSALILHEAMSLNGLIGAILIIGAAIISEIN